VELEPLSGHKPSTPTDRNPPQEEEEEDDDDDDDDDEDDDDDDTVRYEKLF